MSKPDHACREGCAACCIAPSISSLIPGMPEGKPAGVRCVQLDAALACLLFSHPDRPAVCASLKPSAEMCGDNREQALYYLQRLECLTAAGEGVTHEQGKFRADAQNSAVVG